ncbi:MAG: JAB domain-containing protein [Deltaproteobacteria bacterium]
MKDHEKTTPDIQQSAIILDIKNRFRKTGFNGFSDEEMLIFILSYASRDLGFILETSRNLIKKFANLRGVLDADMDEIASNEKTAGQTAALLRLLKDASTECLRQGVLGKNARAGRKDLLNYLTLVLSGEKVEKFMAIYLGSRDEVIAIELLHEGTINTTAVYPRKAIELCYRHGAKGIIFIHNHPSGDATPSEVDRQLAKALDAAAGSSGIKVHDHLIIGKKGHFSSMEMGF